MVDLADLSSVRSAAAEAAAYGSIDLLVNNAGIMATPYRRTVDGFESQLATNHLGPFLLTGLLLPQLAADGRVVTVSSLMHRFAHRPPLGDPQRQGRSPTCAGSPTPRPSWPTCCSPSSSTGGCGSPGRRCRPTRRTRGTPARTWSRTGASAVPAGGIASLLDTANRAIGQSPAVGAWPTLMAATADLPGSTYCGPSGLGEVAGSPRLVGWTRQAGDREAQRALWELSETATGITYP